MSLFITHPQETAMIEDLHCYTNLIIIPQGTQGSQFPHDHLFTLRSCF